MSSSSVQFPCSLPLRVASEAAAAYERLALLVRDQARDLYADFLANGPAAAVDDRQWKSVKRRDGAEVFVDRTRSKSAFLDRVDPRIAPAEILDAADWVPQVRLRVLGQMPGVVTDAVYGAMAPSDPVLMMRSTLTGDEYVDHYTLLEIRTPTSDAPLTHTALKWSLKATAMASLIKARDMTYVETTGFTTVQHNGADERIGYIVTHSIALPKLPSMEKSQGFVRSRSSICTLFRQASAGVVEIFTTAAIAPGGDLPSKLTTKHATDGLLSVCKLTEAAAKRKLVWMQAAWATSAPKALAQLVPKADTENTAQRSVCSQCARALKSATTCEVCDASVCSRCVTSQKLWFSHGKYDIRVKPLSVCKACSTMSQRSDIASAMATYEFVHEPRDSARAKAAQRAAMKQRRSSSSSSTPTDKMSAYGRDMASSYARTDVSSSYTRSMDMSSSYARTDISSSFARSTDLSSSYAQSSYTPSEGSIDDERFSCNRIDEHHDWIVESPAPSSASHPRSKRELWQQMNDLCLQAEHTYYQTQQHTANLEPRFEQRY